MDTPTKKLMHRLRSESATTDKFLRTHSKRRDLGCGRLGLGQGFVRHAASWTGRLEEYVPTNPAQIRGNQPEEPQ